MILVDLRERFDAGYLDAFIRLYNETFTDSAEREDPGQWSWRLRQDCPTPQPTSHLLVAVDEPESRQPRVMGGLAFEHYRESDCGLLTYMVVDRPYRRRGLAARFVGKAIEVLNQDADRDGRPLSAVFGESEDPKACSQVSGGVTPSERLAILKKLGARRIELSYVQPQLLGGSGRCRHLLLLAFHVRGNGQADWIDGEIVKGFLHEFYRALGVARPDDDPDIIEMYKHLRPQTALKEL